MVDRVVQIYYRFNAWFQLYLPTCQIYAEERLELAPSKVASAMKSMHRTQRRDN